MSTAAILSPDFWSMGRATSEQQIAADRLATKAAELRRLTSTAMTPSVRLKAKALRKELTAIASELRKSGL